MLNKIKCDKKEIEVSSFVRRFKNNTITLDTSLFIFDQEKANKALDYYFLGGTTESIAIMSYQGVNNMIQNHDCLIYLIKFILGEFQYSSLMFTNKESFFFSELQNFNINFLLESKIKFISFTMDNDYDVLSHYLDGTYSPSGLKHFFTRTI